MKVAAFSGYSGSGKTTLMEGVIAALKAQGLRVSVIKHAHHAFDIDHPGKDSHRLRSAGAFETLVLSGKRMALVREFEREADLHVHHALAELSEAADWVLVEGFKSSDLLKIEVWRAAAGHPTRYNEDDFIVAIATPPGDALPEPTVRPVLNLNDASAVAAYLLQEQSRFEYQVPY